MSDYYPSPPPLNRDAPDVHTTVGGLTAELKMPPNDPAIFDDRYFLTGTTSGLSNYENYTFLEELTTKYAEVLTNHLGLVGTDSITDIGCALGFLVKVLRDMGHDARGYDISEWAVQNCHPDVKEHLSTSCDFAPKSTDWIHAKDCMEHWTKDQLVEGLPKVLGMARKGCFFIVPLVAYWGGKYIYPADNLDKTHRIRLPIDSWMKMLMEAAAKVDGDFSIHGSYHMTGLKKASVDYPFSVGFLTCRRFS